MQLGDVLHMLSNDSIRMGNGRILLLRRPAIVTVPRSYFLPSLTRLTLKASEALHRRSCLLVPRSPMQAQSRLAAKPAV